MAPQPPAGRSVWIDYCDYAGQLLGEQAPWLSVDAFVGWQRRAAGLVDADVVPVDIAAVLRAWIAAHPELVEQMGAKRRATAPLRTLFADEDLRTHFTDLVTSLGAALSGHAIVLFLPAPEDVAALAYGAVHGGDLPELDEDDVDSAAVYLADFLRSLAQARLDAVVIGAPTSGAPVTPELIDLYGPLLKVAAHYRWSVGLRAPEPVEGLPAALAPSFWLTDAGASGGAHGVVVADGFWGGDTAPPEPAGGFRYVVIPTGTRPEIVLNRLAELHARA